METTSTSPSLIFTSESGNTQMEIGSTDKDNEIEFYIIQNHELTSVYLSQQNIADLIQHLQKNLIK